MNYPDLLFDAFMYPLEAVSLTAKRRERMAQATGDVLELGSGTGANMDHYLPSRIRSLTLTDLSPSDRLHERANRFRERAVARGLERARNGYVSVEHADVCELRFDADTFDTVVFTLVFCSVPDQRQALAEVRRVVRPGGVVIFIEHVRPKGPLGHVVDSLNPIWHAATRECNINRDTAAAIREAGLRVQELRVSGGGLLMDGYAREPD